MHIEANEEYSKANNKLNEVYKNLLLEYKSDSEFIEKLQRSQRIWIQLRDAELEMKYPAEDKQFYGSVYPVCALSYLTELTKKRAEHLKNWIEGVKEGEVCSGSVKIK